MNLIETQTQSTTLFTGKIITLQVDEVKLPNDHLATREVIRHPGACCILAETAEQQVILVKQFRYPCGTVLLEIPAGKLDIQDEDPKIGALRELAEETPYTAQSAELIFEFFSAPGFCDEKLYLYHAQGVAKNSTLSADEDEFVETVLMNKAEVQAALNAQHIQDAKTLIALQYWLMQSA